MSTPRRSRRPGSVESAFNRALTVARRDGRLLADDAAAVAVGRAAARLVDDAAGDGTVWMREAAIRRAVETYRELRLTPSTRPPDPADDPLTVALAEFAASDNERRTHRLEADNTTTSAADPLHPNGSRPTTTPGG